MKGKTAAKTGPASRDTATSRSCEDKPYLFANLL